MHLNDLGQLAMAWAMLKGAGRGGGGFDAVVDAAAGESGQRHRLQRVTDVKKLADGVTFVRKDFGLPMNLGVLSALQYQFIPVPDTLNGYRLTVKGLAAGRYSQRGGTWARHLGREAVGRGLEHLVGDGGRLQPVARGMRSRIS